MKKNYVHGYSERESSRLYDQANTLSEMLHYDTIFPKGSKVLEAGCGTGAQTVILAKKNPDAQILSVDISKKSLVKAQKLIKKEKITNVEFELQDIFHLYYEEEIFDHIFICFVLEHIENPVKILKELKRFLKKGGTITVIEGDHGSVYFYPESEDALLAIQCQIKIQAGMKGNSLIGRQVYPLLKQAGFKNVKVSPRMVYVDSSKPELVDGFTKKTFISMIEGVEDQAISMGLIDKKTWQKGIKELYRTAKEDGVFCYTFFKGIGTK